MRSEKRGLSQESLAALLQFLDEDPLRAAAEYERIRQRLMKLFRWRGCLSFEEYADTTVDRVASLVAEGAEVHTANRYALFYGVATNLLREHWRGAERQRLALQGLGHQQVQAESPDETLTRHDELVNDEKRRRCLRRCLSLLPADSLALIRRYYGHGDILDKNQRKQLAGELNVSVNALRVRAHRIRAEVGRCIGSCLAGTAWTLK
jgi:DNA-directed RNA polymerase specialized sigma24 family protein